MNSPTLVTIVTLLAALTCDAQPVRRCNPLDIELLDALCETDNPHTPPKRTTKLAGTWFVSFSPADAKSFDALVTFHADGTVAGTTPQSLDFGVWSGANGEYFAVMEAFNFDRDGNPIGRRRIRSAVHIAKPGSFQAEFVIDLITPDGTTMRGVANGTAVAAPITVFARTDR